MNFCDPCARLTGWPETLSKADAPCEVCGAHRPCNTRPYRELPSRADLRIFVPPRPRAATT